MIFFQFGALADGLLAYPVTLEPLHEGQGLKKIILKKMSYQKFKTKANPKQSKDICHMFRSGTDDINGTDTVITVYG